MSSTVTVISYAPYIEIPHVAFLHQVAKVRDNIIDSSPYADFETIDIDNAFLGAGYTLTSFASLFDMFGKFMAGFDIEKIWNEAYKILISSHIDDLSKAEAALFDDRIETQDLPALSIQMRDINAVTTSTFIIAKANIEKNRLKALSQFNNSLRYNLISEAQTIWQEHLNWNRAVIENYAKIIKAYFSQKLDVEEFNNHILLQDKLWPFTVLDWQRNFLAALQGTTTTASSFKKKEPSQLVKSVSGAASGAVMGSAGGLGWGTVIGAIIGFALSFLD